jgi:hypothetical protein
MSNLSIIIIEHEAELERLRTEQTNSEMLPKKITDLEEKLKK